MFLLTAQDIDFGKIMATVTNPSSPAAGVAAWQVVFSLASRELVRFFRESKRVFGALGQPIIFWLLFSEGFAPSGLEYTHFFPGVLVMILLFTAIFSTISIIEDRREGFLQGVLVAPVPRWAMVLGKVLGGTTIAMLQGLVFLLLGWLFVSDVSPSWSNLLLAIVFMSVVALALTSLGFILAWRMNSVQGYHAIMSCLLFPMWLLSGAFFPSASGDWLSWVVAFNPLTYGVTGLRYYLTEHVAAGPTLTFSWMITLLFALLTTGVACQIARTRTTGDLL
jgi:ABC-2 type transport system permease protein